MSVEIWIVDASPLISLAKIGRLDLLAAKERRVVIPDAVVSEVLAGPETDPARVAVAAGFGERRHAEPIDLRVSQWGLGPGESAVLTLAGILGATAILDDRDARVAAAALGIACLGTLGVVIRAKKQGSVPSASAVIRELRGAGLRLSDEVIRVALRKAFNEVWEQ